MIYTSIQRWIYAASDSLPNALRELAEDIESYEVTEDENTNDFSNCVIDCVYDENADEELAYRVGVCISWKPAK